MLSAILLSKERKSDKRVEIRQMLLSKGAIAMLTFPRARPAGVLDDKPASPNVLPFRYRIDD